MVDNTHAVEEFRANFRNDCNMISRQLKAHGYRTGYFGKWHVERSINPGAFGFDRFETEHHGRTFPRTLIERRAVRHPGYNERTLYGVHKETVAETEEHFFYTEGIEFIREAAKDPSVPWCAFISTNAPHDPYIAPKELYDRYDPSSFQKPESFEDTLTDKPNIYRRIKGVWDELSWQDYQEAKACYYANCTLVDIQVGRILDFLTVTGQLEDTLIVYMSDHGDLMGGHGLLCKGIPAFEEVYRIPLILSWPGKLPTTGECEVPVSIVDVAPTTLELAGCRPMEQIDGQSVLPLITDGSAASRRISYAEFYGQRLSCTQRIVWKNNFKYVYNGFDFDELYDLDLDPHELNNLAQDLQYRETVDDMAREMWNKVKESGDRSLLESEYFMYRFAPVGPEQEKQDSIYNRGA
jgi:arylsulfatase A-like enzyme